MLEKKIPVWLVMRDQTAQVHIYYNTIFINAASLEGTWRGLAVPCSTLLSGCFQFSNFNVYSCQKLVVTDKSVL